MTLSTLREKCPNTELFLVRISPHLDWIRTDTEYLSVLSPNTGKYGPEKIPYLDTFYAVVVYHSKPSSFGHKWKYQCSLFRSFKYIVYRYKYRWAQQQKKRLEKALNTTRSPPTNKKSKLQTRNRSFKYIVYRYKYRWAHSQKKSLEKTLNTTKSPPTNKKVKIIIFVQTLAKTKMSLTHALIKLLKMLKSKIKVVGNPH